MIFDDATRAQIDAARPDASTWLGANAGSGKTRVLTDRVARLLLDGVKPQHILCLTYTKAAASEMQNRLFRRLGAWAMLQDDALRQEMVQLGVEGALDGDRLRKARTLFALATETPGGLKIQTIHSFCASLLRRFPLEAGVSPQFTEIEDRAADLLRDEILDQMAQGKESALITAVAQFYGSGDFGKLTKAVVGLRDAFTDIVTRDELLALFGQPANLDARQVEKSVFLGSEQALFDELVPAMMAGSTNDIKIGKVIGDIKALNLAGLPTLENVFLTKGKAKPPFTAKIGSVPTKKTQKSIGHLMPELEALMQRVEEARDQRLALLAAEKALALHQFANAFLDRYEVAKQLRGWLDFDDLILKARALLHDKAVAAWVLYRIDGGIDHILVDEAQDTSPRQWDVIEKLADEFHSGAGARTDVARTLFVVGDKKQSIYSFQGADPREFDQKASLFEEKILGAGQPFQRRSLDYSFRSSNAILRLVDTVFDPRRRPDFDKQSQHIAFKSDLPGRVDLWPLVETEKENDKPDWTDPLDRLSAQDGAVVLADQIATQISRMVNPYDPTFIPDDGATRGTFIKRPVRPGDFLILVQRRSALFSEIIRACKVKKLPIAGADRLKVGAELAVKDIQALLSFLATPDDSLSLATALKSPIFAWSEQELFDLAHRRDSPILWEALRNKQDTHAQTLDILHDMRGQVDFLRPYDLIERVLTRHGGRKALLARLGLEAEDGINAMLTQALAYERNDVPSLTGFIEWMQTDDLEIKRQIDSASNQIRVMTVHGSKGLEAPIVILPDSGKRDIRLTDEIIKQNGVPIWKPSQEDAPEPIRETTQAIKDAEQAERMRLFYVAMTRAEKWLIIAAQGNLPANETAWYQITEEAMKHINATEVDDTGILRFQEGDWDGLESLLVSEKMTQTSKLDPVFEQDVPTYSHPQDVLSPSDLGGAKALPNEEGKDSDAAMAYGTLVHTLLEKLPFLESSSFDAQAKELTQDVDPEIAQQAIDEAGKIVSSPALATLFSVETLSEVPITADVRGRRLHGIIDKLIISPDHVLLVDYKTNRAIPTTAQACPEGILRQMGAYSAMLAQIYPNHDIQTAVLWTKDATLMYLPHDLVTEAFIQSPYLDVDGARS
ncbi:MAG: double-strand break repair helicase AddA [Sulfitobacter sp.]